MPSTDIAPQPSPFVGATTWKAVGGSTLKGSCLLQGVLGQGLFSKKSSQRDLGPQSEEHGSGKDRAKDYLVGG